MTIYSTIAAADRQIDTGKLVTAAARFWRAARDRHEPTQQSLYAMLSAENCEMLAPVFDSLMTLCEGALGRELIVGDASLSDDEALLIGLLDGSKRRRACIDCMDSSGHALDCAICSTRIMMGMTIGSSAGVLRQ